MRVEWIHVSIWFLLFKKIKMRCLVHLPYAPWVQTVPISLWTWSTDLFQQRSGNIPWSFVSCGHPQSRECQLGWSHSSAKSAALLSITGHSSGCEQNLPQRICHLWPKSPSSASHWAGTVGQTGMKESRRKKWERVDTENDGGEIALYLAILNICSNAPFSISYWL